VFNLSPRCWVTLALLPVVMAVTGGADGARADQASVCEAPPSPPPADRYRADILIVVYHPGDEMMVTGYLARVLYDEHKRVAVTPFVQ
jgi:hypothetical protein